MMISIEKILSIKKNEIFEFYRTILSRQCILSVATNEVRTWTLTEQIAHKPQLICKNNLYVCVVYGSVCDRHLNMRLETNREHRFYQTIKKTIIKLRYDFYGHAADTQFNRETLPNHTLVYWLQIPIGGTMAGLFSIKVS